MDNQGMSSFRLSRRQFAQTVMAFVGGASVFSNPFLRWLSQAHAPAAHLALPTDGAIGGVLLFADKLDTQAAALGDRLADINVMESDPASPAEAWTAAERFTHPQLGGSTFAVIGVGSGAVHALQLAHSHPAVGAAVLVGSLPDGKDWQSGFALLQQRGARTLVLPGSLDHAGLDQAERFIRQFAV